MNLSLGAARGALEKTPLRRHRILVSRGSVGVVLMLLLALLLAARGGPTTETAPKVDDYGDGPRLALDNRSLDFGNAARNQEIKARFTLRNVDDQPLRVEKVDVSTLEGC